MKKISFDLVVFLCGMALLFVWYSDVLLNINQTYFLPSGDGLKNYYTTLYQVKFGTEFWHFQGMNYPYGENLVFTDAQPLLVGFLQLLVFFIPSSESYLLGIINLLLLVSIPLSAVFMQRILSHYEIKKSIALLSSLALAFFAPQLFRLAGHYGLAYMFVIPLFYLLLLKYLKHKKLFISILMSIILVLCAFLHLYYLLIIGFFLSAFWLVNAIKSKEYKTALIQWGLQVILPFIVTLFLLKFYDQVTDRPSSPYGFLSYRALWEGLIFSMDSQLVNWFEENVVGIRHVGSEARMYLGFFAVSAILIYFTNLFVSKFKSYKLPIPDRNILIGTLLLTTFSLGIPFIYGLDFLIQYLGPLQQFRGIGRFAWPLFYVLNINIVIVLYYYKDQILNNKKQLVALSVICLVFIAEIYLKNTRTVVAINNTNVYQKDEIDSYLTKNKNTYQALIPLPFFHIGSEFLGKETTDDLIKKTFMLSLNTGIPIFSHMASRTSFAQTMSYYDFFYANIVSTSLMTIEERPFLVIIDKQREALQIGEYNIIAQANLLFETDQFIVKSLKNLNFKPATTIVQVEKPDISNLVLVNDEFVNLPIQNLTSSFSLDFEIARPTNQEKYADYRLYISQNGVENEIKIDGNQDIRAIDASSFYYHKNIDLSGKPAAIRLVAKTIGNTETVLLKNLSLQALPTSAE